VITSTHVNQLFDVEWSAEAVGPLLPLDSNCKHTRTQHPDTATGQRGVYRLNVRIE
jgi:hypothetical protein